MAGGVLDTIKAIRSGSADNKFAKIGSTLALGATGIISGQTLSSKISTLDDINKLFFDKSDRKFELVKIEETVKVNSYDLGINETINVPTKYSINIYNSNGKNCKPYTIDEKTYNALYTNSNQTKESTVEKTKSTNF